MVMMVLSYHMVIVIKRACCSVYGSIIMKIMWRESV